MKTFGTMGLVVAMSLCGAARAEAQSEAAMEAAQSEPTWWLVGIGTGVLLGEYVGELIATAATGGDAGELERAAIPFAGPWLELAEGDLRWWEIALTVYEGAMQIVALGALIVGLAWQQPIEPAEDVALTLEEDTRLGGISLGWP